MKKYISLFLLLAMLLSMAACGSSTPAETKPAETAAPETTEAAPETTAAAAEPEAPAQEEAAQPAVAQLEDGVYTVDFETDSSMFHINEAYDGKATLVVQDGAMTVHITLVSKSILNLYVGLAEDAKNDEANWLQPTEDEVTYADGFKETVYGFDVPVPTVEQDFDLALIGKKGTWYDHTVSVRNPVLQEG